MKGRPPLGPIIGPSAAMRRVRELIERYAPTGMAVLLVGATGTGKELVARHIHVRSGRRGRFVGVNCAALPRDMAEGLLFGYERGAFSGAVRQHRGHFECAHGGTLFLDELLSLPLDEQAKLLRALDSGEIQRLGADAERYVDARVIGAVQEDAREHVAMGPLRPDLYQRLAALVIELPPLAERPEDVVPLAEHFAAEQGQQLEPGAPRALTDYAWPGNVRELRQVIARAGCAVENGTLPVSAVKDAIALCNPSRRAGETGRTPALGAHLVAERQRVLSIGVAVGWDRQLMAAALGLRHSAFYEKLRRLDVCLRDHRRPGISGSSGGIPADDPEN